MTRLLALAVVAFLLWMVLEALISRARIALSGGVRIGTIPRQGGGRGGSAGAGGQGQQGTAAVAAEELVRCAGCGIHVPRSRVLRTGEEMYCSERCLRLRSGAASS